MEVNSNNSDKSIRTDAIMEDDDDGRPLPGFRFHPTDEELVSFYLRRKVEKRKPLSIEIIKQIDIYKHDPWDLAKESSSTGDKEWYFYCKRGRKYRNSIRPNRVTGSGFWKATGIDRPIYPNGGEDHDCICIGLKKSLVYYRGSAGKGTKTDWMMHEFRLPSTATTTTNHPNLVSISKDETPLEEAEIWTLCRIFKRNKRRTPDWRELSSRKTAANSSSKTSSSIDSNTNQECYINFATHQIERPNNNANYSNIYTANHINNNDIDSNNVERKQHASYNISTGDQKNLHFNEDHHHHHQQVQQQWISMAHTPPCSTPSHLSMLNHVLTTEQNDLQGFGYYGHNWDDLNSVVEFAVKKPFL